MITSVSSQTEYLKTNKRIKDFQGCIAIEERHTDYLSYLS